MISTAVTTKSGASTTSSPAANTRSNARFAKRLGPSYDGVSTWMSGSPATGRVWMREPATPTSCGATTSCWPGSRRQLSSLMRLDEESEPTTMTVSGLAAASVFEKSSAAA